MEHIFRIPRGAINTAFTENLNIECITDNGREFVKIPDFSDIKYEMIDGKYAVFFKHKNQNHIISWSEKQIDAAIRYQKTIFAIMEAYKERESKNITGLGNITQSDIDATIYSVLPNSPN